MPKAFPDENRWPFLGRSDEIKRCLAFLNPEHPDVPSRLLRIAGESGSGKSFFCKELILRFTERAPASIALYVNVEESHFESTDLEKRLSLIASYPATPTRTDPQHIPVNSDLASYLRPLPRWMRGLRYGYNAIRESTSEIPIVGTAVKSLLPSELPVSNRRALASARRIWDYLIVVAKQEPVLLVVDNFQFLSDSVAIELDSFLALADVGFRLVVIDRLNEGVSESWNLRCFSDHRLTLQLSPLSEKDVRDLVTTVLEPQTPNLNEISNVIFRKSEGNPKQVWLQLRTYELNTDAERIYRESKQSRRRANAAEVALGTYEDTIQNLPTLDRITLQLVTLLMGGLKVEDVVAILRRIAGAFSEDEIKRAILDLTLIGLVIVNGSQNNRIRTEHELVSRSVRRITSEMEAIELRQDVIAALMGRLDSAPGDSEYDRLTDRLVGLLSAEDLRHRPDFLAHLISLIDRQSSKERFHYLSSLFTTGSCQGALSILPPHSLEAFLNAFQKISQFDKGLAAAELIRAGGKLPARTLNLYSAKYLVQKFEYSAAENLLRNIDQGSDRDVVLFHILLNLCRDEEAREIVERVRVESHLDEHQCVILRNSSHLYDENNARKILNKAAEGFRRLGSKFGEATTLNNAAVLELWAGNNSAAHALLLDSELIFQSLDSNEIYQPLTNLAILCALENDLNAARRYLDQASVSVSPWLRMDGTMLRFNRFVFELIDGSINSSEATKTADLLYRESLELKDLRFQQVLAWFAHKLQKVFTGSASIPLPENFDERIRNSRRSGLEVFRHASIEGREIPIVFVLSPHWRY